MLIPLDWLAEYTEVAGNTATDEVAHRVMTDLTRVGLEEEDLHRRDLTGPVVVGVVKSFTTHKFGNGKVINWCQVDVGPYNPGGARNPDPAPGTVTESGYRGIICGAHNFAAGDTVVVSLPGAVLPGGFAIAARETYDHVSDGMICSARELGVGTDHAGIIVLDELGYAGLTPGQDALALLGLDQRTVELNVTPDRGYCFSMRGVAREYALAARVPFHDPVALTDLEPGDGHPVGFRDEAPIHGVPGVDRFVALEVRGIDPAAVSPLWLQRRLLDAGMRPVSLAVDVTNYTMLATGQPLHAYDRDRLAGRIEVRRARAGEKLTTLDDVVRDLDPEDLLITDVDEAGHSRVLGLAGVMGGADTEVTTTTRNVLLEAAHFDAVSVARTARRHKIPSEAARRFERGTDPAICNAAAQFAAALLVEFGGGTIVPGPTDVDRRVAPTPVELGAGTPARVVGVDYDQGDVERILTGIGAEVTRLPDGAGWSVTAPSWRPDLTHDVDLVEEIARLSGYDEIPFVVPPAQFGHGLTPAQRARRSVARALAEDGFTEVLSYPFVAADVADTLGLPADDPRRPAVRLVNPLSDEEPALRTFLLPTLLGALARNVGRGIKDLALFETGLVTVGGHRAPAPALPGGTRPADADLARLLQAVPDQPWHAAVVLAGEREPRGWWGEGRPADWTDAVEAVRRVAATTGTPVTVHAASVAPWHPGRCAEFRTGDGTVVGHAGELHPEVVARLELPARTVAGEVDLDALIARREGLVQAVPVSTFPPSWQDVALVVDEAVPAAEVESALTEGAGTLLEDIRLFDVYRSEEHLGAGKKSLAYRLTFRAPDRTLTADEASAARTAATDLAAARHGAVVRA